MKDFVLLCMQTERLKVGWRGKLRAMANSETIIHYLFLKLSKKMSLVIIWFDSLTPTCISQSLISSLL